MLYHGIANTQFSYELPQNQFGETLIEQMSFGEILLLDQEESGVSNTLYYMLNIYNDDGDIKNLPNPVTVISAISVPINRSEKWGIFIAKYNPSLQNFYLVMDQTSFQNIIYHIQQKLIPV